MLGGVSNNGNENQTNESLADTSSLDEIINASNKIFGAHGDEDSRDDENGASSNGTQSGLLDFLALVLSLDFSIEKVAVGAKLENKVEDVDEEENDGRSTRKDKNARDLLLGTASVENSVELDVMLVNSNSGAPLEEDIQQREE